MGIVAFPLLSLAIGFLLLRAATGGSRYCRHDLFRVALGLGLGTGIGSCAYFLSLVTGTPCFVFDGLLLGVAVGLWFRYGRGVACVFCADSSSDVMRGPGRLLPWALAILSACALVLWITLTLQAPHGQWDAWSIYNLRARFLFRLGPAWRAAFPAEIAWSHPDYPLMLPGAVARIWTYASGESTWAQSGVALGFSMATVGVLVGAAGILKDRTRACVAGILLLSTPVFVAMGAWQYADVPLAFFFLAAVALTCLEARFPARESWFAALAGLAAGLAAWTKNEGLMLALLFGVVRGAPMFFGERKRAERLKYIALIGGALLPMACVFYFKSAIAPANDLIAGQTPNSALSQAASFSRIVDVALAFANHIFSFSGIVPPTVIATALYVICMGVVRPLGASVRLIWVLLIAALAGYYLTYLLSPGDLNFRVATSLDRILIQLWPSVLLACILTGRQAQT